MHTLFTICLMFCGIGTALCDASSEQFTFNRTVSRMTTFIRTEDVVYHMDRDQYTEGNLLFSDLHSLKTTDGRTTQIIAGDDLINGGYREASGRKARFRYVTAFCQISKTTVVVNDNGNHCLRLIDRPSGQTRTLSGSCTHAGYKDGINALYEWPRSVIIDNQDKGKLLVTDEKNKAVRHVDISTGAATTFFVDRTVNFLLGITQEVSSGNLYLSSYSDIYTLNYQNKVLTHIAGSHGNKGGAFFAFQFNKPRALLLLDNKKKLLIADDGNDRLMVLDRESNTTNVLCGGDTGHRDGDLRSCSLFSPRSLLVVGDTLYIGEDPRVRMISGSTILLTSPTTSPTNGATPSTISAATPMIRTTITPVTTHAPRPTPISTAVPSQLPMDMSPCKRGNITKELQPGEKAVYVEIEPGRTARLPAGEYLFLFTSVLENCTIHVHITKAISSTPSQDLCSPATQKDYSISSSESGFGDLDITCGDVGHRLSLPVGEYKYQKLHKDDNCSALIDVKDNQLVRRLNIKAEYDVPCDSLTDPVTKSSVTAVADSHFIQIEGPTICGHACKRQKEGDIQQTCVNMTLSIMWPTDQTYGGHVTDVPVGIRDTVKPRLRKFGGPSLKIFIMSRLPP